MTGKPYQIVIDTNILVAGLRSRRGAAYKLLTMLNDKRWQVNISTTLLMEYEEVLKRELENLFVLNEQDIDDFLDGICHIANHQDVFYIWRLIYGVRWLMIRMMIFLLIWQWQHKLIF